MDKEWMAAFEKHRKKIYGRNPCPIDAITHFGAGWNAAVAAERERCAKICEDNADEFGEYEEGCKNIASAIRA